MAKLKLQGSTLVESLVAMIIIVGAFSTGTVLFMMVTSSNQSEEELRASIVASNQFAESEGSNVFMDEMIEVDQLFVEKVYSMNQEDARELTIKVSSGSGELLFTESRVVR